MFQRNMYEGNHNPLDMIPNNSESDLAKIRDDDLDSKSGSENLEGVSGDEQDPNQRPKKKRYHRHTPHQIQEMEAFFKECPHPDDKQRKELGNELGLEPLQVKFWFQNKRTQMKTQQERYENSHLRTENEKLRADNVRLKQAIDNVLCPNCGGPTIVIEMPLEEQHLRRENIQLKEEINRISGVPEKYAGKPMLSYPLLSPQIAPRGLDLSVGNYGMQPGMGGDLYGRGEVFRSLSGTTEADKPFIVELAVAAMDELVRMAQLGEPLWERDPQYGHETLNENEYMRMFPRGIGPRPPTYKTESSRETGIVIMNHMSIVEILMDVTQWSTMFSSIVSRAMPIDILSQGNGGDFNGGLQVMTAEYQVPTPFVPTRESLFLRYSKKHSEGMWAVVDVSIDHLHPSSTLRCRRRPSGCLIQECQNGYSKVVWIEHVEVDDSRPVNSIYKQLINSTYGFGAKRWIATLDRQCERFASVLASIVPAGDVGVITTNDGRKSLLKLAERMVMSFCSGVSASTAHTWTSLSGDRGIDADRGVDVRVMTKKSVDDPGRPAGIVLSAATSFWLPVEPKKLFDFLRDENTRSKWDILSNGGDVVKMAQIANGRDPGNSVSLLRVNSVDCTQSNMLILQEGSSDATASFIIYAPVDLQAMNIVLGGGDPDYVALLPSGFAILPDGRMLNRDGAGKIVSGGSLLTVAFQILVDSAPTAKLSLNSVETVNNLISCTVGRITQAIEDAKHDI